MSSIRVCSPAAEAYGNDYFEARYRKLSAQLQLDDLLLQIAPIHHVERVLYLGCGVGHLLAKLTENADLAVGIDGSSPATARAHKYGEVLLGDIERPLPFKDRVFDLVFVKDVIEHVSDFAAVLFEISRVTRPGGRVVIVTPNFLALKNLLFLMYGYRHPHYFDPTHRWFFNYIDTGRITRSFEVLVKTTNWIFTPRTLRWVSRIRMLAPLGDSMLLVLRKPAEERTGHLYTLASSIHPP